MFLYRCQCVAALCHDWISVITFYSFIQWQKALICLQVYKAMRSSSQPVAVKVLHEDRDCPDFGQEIALLKACRHSNIVAFQVIHHIHITMQAENSLACFLAIQILCYHQVVLEHQFHVALPAVLFPQTVRSAS